MVLTVSFALSLVIGFLVTVISRIASVSAPGWADTPPQDLTPASRRQDHTTSPSAAASLVSALSMAHGKPALPSHRAPNAAASTASRPAFVTIAIRPCMGRDGAGYGFDLGEAGRNIFLQMGMDRCFPRAPVGQIRGLSRGKPEVRRTGSRDCEARLNDRLRHPRELSGRRNVCVGISAARKRKRPAMRPGGGVTKQLHR
jgi:hypothetical protein